MAQVYFGRRLTAATANGENLATGAAYGQESGLVSVSQSGRIIAIGGWLGAGSQPMNARWSAYTHQSGSNTPNLLMGNTDLGAISWNWTTGSGGQNFERPVASVENGFGASELAILVRQGDRVHIVWQGDETARHGYVPVTGKVRSNRTIAGTTPPNPFSFTSQIASGREYAWYAVIEQNRSPVLSNVAPDEATLNTLNPVFSFRFTDADRTAGYNDYPTRAIVRVYENNAGAYTFVGAHTELLPNPGSGTSFVDVSFDYQGPALTMEKSYVYTVEVQDEIGGTSGTTYAGAVSGSTTPDGSLSFGLSAKGDIATTAPTGKQMTVSPAVFSGNYTHPSASALDKVQLRILKRNNVGQYVVVQTSAEINITDVPSGSVVAVTWATAGFSSLEWSADYAVEWKLTAADASVSDWVGRGYFWTNKIPQKPLFISPEGGDVFTSLPLFLLYVVDDDDVPGGSLASQFEITGPYPLSNAGFDANLTGWTYSESGAFGETVTRVTTGQRSGAGAAQISMASAPASTSATFTYLLGDQHPCVVGEVYSAVAYMNRSNTTPTGAAIIQWFTAADVLISTTEGAYATPAVGTYQQMLVAGSAPATAAYFKVGFRGKNTTTSPTVPFVVTLDDFFVSSGVRYIRTSSSFSNDNFSYQTVFGDVPSVAFYTVRGRAVDASNSGPWSDPILFSYASGITGTITVPTGGASLATSSPTLTWTVDTGGPQTRYRIDIQDADSGENVYDSLWIVGSEASFTIPLGYIGSSGSYVARLWLDNGSVQSLVDTVAFLTSYSAPAAPDNFQANPYQHAGEPEASSVMLTWNPVDTDPANVERFEIWANEGDGIKRIATFEGGIGAAVSSFVYPFPRSGRDIEFSARQIVQQNGGAVETGLWAQAYARVDLTALYLVSAVSPMDRRLAIRYWQEPTITPTQVQQWSTPAGALDYVEVPSSLRGRDLSYTAEFIDHQDGSGITAQQDQDTLDALFDGILSSDGERRTSDVLCFRDPRSYKHFVRFNGNPNTRQGKGAVRFANGISMRRVSYVEGV
jgi:hypothetical protein